MTAKRYLRKTSLEESRRLLFEEVGAAWGGGVERVPVIEALGRVLGRPVTALFSSPAYHASAMDGFAVDARLTFEANESNPVFLEVEGQAAPVDTGDALPEGANAVLMVEDAHFGEGGITIYRSLAPYENVRLMGEDVVAGELLLPAGKVLTPFDVGLCLSGGVTRVDVRRRPVVGIVPTGDELISPGQLVERGKIVEFNSAVLSGLVRQRGGEPLVWPILPDDPAELERSFREALRQVDILVVNAGSSAGRDDYTARIIGGAGKLLVHGVSIMPGKPTALGVVDGKPVVGLPGYPASAIVSFEQFVLPLVDRFLGWEDADRTLKARLARDLPSRPGHAEFVRGQAGRVGDRLVFTPLGRGASLLSSYARANAVAEIPRESEGVERGEEVTIRRLVPVEEIDRSILLAGSHDLALEVLREGLLSPPGRLNLMISTQGSLGGLVLLFEGFAHLATCHLLDPETGEYNRPYVARFLANRPARLLHVAMRQQGLMVARGNPRGVAGLADLCGGDLTFVNRQRGSGTRILLDHLLAEQGKEGSLIRGYEREEITHLNVAAAVAGGLADAGLGILAAAAALGLDFIPLAREPFDLVVTEDFLESPAVGRIVEELGTPRFRRRLEELGGYDTAAAGTFD